MKLISLIRSFLFIFLIFSTNFVLADQCKLDGLSDLSTDPPFDSYDGAVQVSMHPVFVKLGPVAKPGSDAKPGSLQSLERQWSPQGQTRTCYIPQKLFNVFSERRQGQGQ